jgi:hypothetical protein
MQNDNSQNPFLMDPKIDRNAVPNQTFIPDTPYLTTSFTTGDNVENMLKKVASNEETLSTNSEYAPVADTVPRLFGLKVGRIFWAGMILVAVVTVIAALGVLRVTRSNNQLENQSGKQ